jgi:hypothetical protein
MAEFLKKKNHVCIFNKKIREKKYERKREKNLHDLAFLEKYQKNKNKNYILHAS